MDSANNGLALLFERGRKAVLELRKSRKIAARRTPQVAMGEVVACNTEVSLLKGLLLHKIPECFVKTIVKAFSYFASLTIEYTNKPLINTNTSLLMSVHYVFLSSFCLRF